MKRDYKNTLHLPDTGFPMKGQLALREPERVKAWQEKRLYEKICAHTKGKPPYILHWGPPYANGAIHMGHAITSILKDIIVKAKRLSGYDAPLVPGWDCHGLPIEAQIEKQLGNKKETISPDAFRERCRTYAASQVALQKAAFIRLGILADWDHPYNTMNYRYEADSIRALAGLVEKGHLQAGQRPVHWCVACGSALAEAEVEYQEKVSPAIDVAFPILEPMAFCEAIGATSSPHALACVIWTTTPWTLPANQALAVHPEISYVLLQGDFGRFQGICVAEPLVEACLARYQKTRESVTLLARFLGKQIEHQKGQHPFCDRIVPIILGKHVTTDMGTGIVHTAPAHGLEDAVISKQYGLPIETEVDAKGHFLPKVPWVGGLSVWQANAEIVGGLQKAGYLLSEMSLRHSYPHCWRHKTPLIFRATSQWFVRMDQGLRERALKAVGEIQWIPEWGAARMQAMLTERPDWCLSRQRLWGVPLPLLLHKETRKPHPQTVAIMQEVAHRVEEKGIEAWYHMDPETLPFPEMAQYEKSTDVLDVWFDSGVSHVCVLRKRKDLRFPADLYLEGSDQYRGWFQSALLTSLALYGVPPYRRIVTHGFVVDAEGRKMSKSLGNVIAPEKIIDTLGADVLRLWVAAADYQEEIPVSHEIFNRIQEAYRRIRNTIRFLLANLKGFDPKTDKLPHASWLALDAWVVDEAARVQREIVEAYDRFQPHRVYQKIHHFCVVTLGSFYLDVIKDRQYTMQEKSTGRRSAQSALYEIAHALLRWLTPILSFTAEEAWTFLPKEEKEEHSLFVEKWRELPSLSPGVSLDNAFWQAILDVRQAVNKALEQERQQGHIGSSLEAEIRLFAEGARFAQLQRLGEELRFVLMTSQAEVLPLDARSSSAFSVLNDLWVEVRVSRHEKCVRCWHRRADVDHDPDYPGLCGRCVRNLNTLEGEERHYA